MGMTDFLKRSFPAWRKFENRSFNPMIKRPPPRNDQARFNGALRHYHRSGSQARQAWEEWVDAKAATSRKSVNWLKIITITAALLALGGIIAGLIIELR